MDSTIGALNANPVFAAYANPTGAPDGWSAVGAPVIARVAGLDSSYAANIQGVVGVTGGIQIPVAGTGPDLYVLAATITLTAGSLVGSGMKLSAYTDPTLATPTESVIVTFAEDPDINGVIQGDGVVGTTYRFSRLVLLADPTSADGVLFAYANNIDGAPLETETFSAITDDGQPITDGISAAAPNAITFNLCLCRLATAADILGFGGVDGMIPLPMLSGQSPQVRKNPTWSTTAKRSASGLPIRRQELAYPIWEFDVSFDVLRATPTHDEVAQIFEFFNEAMGRARPWLFLDPSDYRAVGAPIGTGDGTTTAFQLSRQIDSFAEPVFAAFGVTVFDNGSPAAASLGPGGVVTFLAPPAAGHALTWTGFFFFVCRFEDDDLTLDEIYAQLWGLKDMKFVTAPPR